MAAEVATLDAGSIRDHEPRDIWMATGEGRWPLALNAVVSAQVSCARKAMSFSVKNEAFSILERCRAPDITTN